MMVNLPCLMVSCTNFLRPTCSYTECQLSFQTGSCPTERTTASYSSCLYLILLTFFLLQENCFSVDALPCFICWSYWDAVHFTLHLVYGFLIQNLMKLDVPRWAAFKIAYCGDRYARLAHNGWVQKAISNKRLASFGLVSMLDYYTERCVTC